MSASPVPHALLLFVLALLLAPPRAGAAETGVSLWYRMEMHFADPGTTPSRDRPAQTLFGRSALVEVVRRPASALGAHAGALAPDDEVVELVVRDLRLLRSARGAPFVQSPPLPDEDVRFAGAFFLVQSRAGLVRRVLFDEHDAPDVVAFKKGLASAFHAQLDPSVAGDRATGNPAARSAATGATHARARLEEEDNTGRFLADYEWLAHPRDLGVRVVRKRRTHDDYLDFADAAVPRAHVRLAAVHDLHVHESNRSVTFVRITGSAGACPRARARDPGAERGPSRGGRAGKDRCLAVSPRRILNQRSLRCGASPHPPSHPSPSHRSPRAFVRSLPLCG